MISGSRWLAWPCLVALCAGCSESVTRPAPVGDCRTAECDDFRGNLPPTLGVGAGMAGDGGGGGEGGAGGMPGPQVGTLAGSVRMITEPDLVSSTELDGEVEVRAPGALEDEVSTVPAADGTFRLEGVLPNAPIWVAVGSFDDSAADPFMTTFQAVDATQAQFIELQVMQRTVMTDIAGVSFMSGALDIDPERGHAFVTFVDQDGQNVPGVQISALNGGENAAVAYDAGQVYSDQVDQTSNRGTAVLMNLLASPYPGGTTTITADLAGVPYTTPIRVAAGAVTVVSATIGP